MVDADIGVGALTVTHDASDGFDRGPRFGPRFRRHDDDDDEVGNVGCEDERAAR